MAPCSFTAVTAPNAEPVGKPVIVPVTVPSAASAALEHASTTEHATATSPNRLTKPNLPSNNYTCIPGAPLKSARPITTLVFALR
jgi:hypothetical protein